MPSIQKTSKHRKQIKIVNIYILLSLSFHSASNSEIIKTNFPDASNSKNSKTNCPDTSNSKNIKNSQNKLY